MALPQLVQAEMQFKDDHYSESARWTPGYSDCSSFVGKSLKTIGITPPGGSTTTDYLLSPDWILINRSELQAGDICVNAAHMVTALDGQNAIGQQNPNRNVAQGPIDDMMYGTGGFVCKRYNGSMKGVTQASFNVGTAGLGSDLLSFPEGIINFFNEVTTGQFWLRAIMVIGGGLLLLFAMKQIVWSGVQNSAGNVKALVGK
ncbi:MAG TPA: peptidoglycan amidohydrolase family protein [Bryobacteraceae bacterium]